MDRSLLSYGFDNSLSCSELFELPEGSDRTLPPLSELIMSAQIVDEDVDEALDQWREEFPTAQYRLILDAEADD
jgi:hypothetical protein